MYDCLDSDNILEFIDQTTYTVIKTGFIGFDFKEAYNEHGQKEVKLITTCMNKIPKIN